MNFLMKKFQGDNEEWDSFITKKSMNGTFLQTRKFLNYHPVEKYDDFSVLVYKGKELISVIPACIIFIDGKKCFYSHKGTTFGGIIISEIIYNVNLFNLLMEELENFLRNALFEQIYLKLTPALFCKKDSVLIDYFLYKKNYREVRELNFYLDLTKYRTNILTEFSSSKRRDYRYSLKNNLIFKELNTDNELNELYFVMQLNLKKLNLPCVHKLEELLDLKKNRFPNNINFYGVILNNEIVAGSMTFKFGKNIFHTQYLVSNENYLKYYIMDFLIYNLIDVAIKDNIDYFTFGICTENEGKYLNFGLSKFKEGFGADYILNNSYEKLL